MISFFKIYKTSIAEAPVNQIYNLFPQLKEDMLDQNAINFNLDTFLNRNMTTAGEIKLPKGLWIFDIMFNCDLRATAGGNVAVQEIFTIDFGVQACLNQTITNDRPVLLYTGFKDGLCYYKFQVNNLVDNALFKMEFKPICKKRDNDRLIELSGLAVRMLNFSLSGSRLSDYANLQITKTKIEVVEEEEKIIKKSKTATPQ
jgi:hypothetical protein